MKTKAYNVYTFSELSQSARETAKRRYYETEEYEFLGEELKERLSQIAPYWEDVKIFYSLSCCQGDGLSFEGTLDIKKFLDTKSPSFRRPKVMQDYIYKIISTGNKGRYTYASRGDVDWECNYSHGKERKRLDKAALSILEAVQDNYLSICKNLERYGYSILEYRMDDKEFEDLSDSNEWEYTIDGIRD
jgi:hypothetical protein